MQDRGFKVIIAALLALFIGQVVYAGSLDISKIGIGARAIAMGRAQAAAKDYASVFINPANAYVLDKFGASSMYASLAEDLSMSQLGLVFPIKEGALGTAGVSYISSTLSGLQATSLDAYGRTYPTSNFDFGSKLMMFSYGKKISPTISAGLSFKVFSKNFEGIQGGSGAGSDLDLGVNFYPDNKLTVGAVLQNLLPQEFGAMNWGSGLKEDIPINIKIGANYTPQADLLVLADYDSSGIIHLGGEYWIRKGFALRGGVENHSNMANVTTGVGLKYAGFQFDYAYCMDVAVWANAAHYFSLGYELPIKTLDSRPILPASRTNSLAFLD